MDGGIFYTKSYNNGNTYKQEEIVNKTGHFVADGNKNPFITETMLRGNVGFYPVNKNVAACWERYNSANGKMEIKTAVRSYNIFSDTSFFWISREDNNYSDVFTSFNSNACGIAYNGNSIH